jgi:4-diphosphocytidyl-2-C-methyl-D-erythritol kinase
LKNDFEEVVFKIHPQLAAVTRKLRKLGARPARMTGSGSAVFGIFSSALETREAARQFPAAAAFPVRFLSRSQYQKAWR